MADMISVGVTQPGVTATSCRTHQSTTSSLKPGVGAEGDLHNVHAAGQQGLRRGDRVIRVFKDHNGNHRRVPEPFQTVHKGSLAFPNINSIA